MDRYVEQDIEVWKSEEQISIMFADIRLIMNKDQAKYVRDRITRLLKS